MILIGFVQFFLFIYLLLKFFELTITTTTKTLRNKRLDLVSGFFLLVSLKNVKIRNNL